MFLPDKHKYDEAKEQSAQLHREMFETVNQFQQQILAASNRNDRITVDRLEKEKTEAYKLFIKKSGGINFRLIIMADFLDPETVQRNQVIAEDGLRLSEEINVFNKSHNLAMGAEHSPGGIDFKSDKVDNAFAVKMDSRLRGNDREGIKFYIDPAMLQQLQNAPGFVPVIINIQPMTDLQMFLGLKESNDPSRLSKVM